MSTLKHRLLHVAAELPPGDPARRQLLGVLRSGGGAIPKMLDQATATFDAAVAAARKQQDATREKAARSVQQQLDALGIPVQKVSVAPRGHLVVYVDGSWTDMSPEERQAVHRAFGSIAGDRTYGPATKRSSWFTFVIH